MIVRVAQVKCFSCGRICGEVHAPSVRELTLEKVYVPSYAAGLVHSGNDNTRCRRCGGMVYLDEPFSLGSAEIMGTEESRKSLPLAA